MEGNYFWYDSLFYRQFKGVAMGAKFAPSVANLFMSKWESEAIFFNRPQALALYRRYIDDIMIIWTGSLPDLESFLREMNTNNYGIKFTSTYSATEIHFLDLVIFVDGGKPCTKSFFKETDRNSFIPTDSCHHPKWKDNIPKGQLLRMRRNCTKIEDYQTQSRTMPPHYKKISFRQPIVSVYWSSLGRISYASAHPSLSDKPPISVCSNPCPKGFRRANRQGQKICCFDCVPCSEGEILNPKDATECLKCPEDQWPNTFKEKCVKKPIQFLAYDEILGFSLASISIICGLLTFSVLCLFLVKHKTPIVKANNRELSYLLLVSLVFCFLCSLVFIGRPSMLTCMLRQIVFGIIFSICLSIILAKTITVIMVFRATNPVNTNMRKLLRLRMPIYIIPFCSFIQIVICLIWLTSSAPFEEFNMFSEIGTIIIECNEGSKILFSCVLGYMGLLAFISLIVAFLARNLPDTFNEAKFITFSMLVFASVWITFIPAYLSTKGKYMVAVEIFAIISSSAGLLICIFFPKCYIILLQPEMNDKKYITGSRRR
ncbi:vomeronasal type-2 receptor 26-like [Mantella aurantiaca]